MSAWKMYTLRHRKGKVWVVTMKWQDKLGKIIWLNEPTKYTYLRERMEFMRSSRFPIKTFDLSLMALVVGYELVGRRPDDTFMFRVWWLKSVDRDFEPDGSYKDNCPREAVMPSSIAVGKKSMPYYPLVVEERGQ